MDHDPDLHDPSGIQALAWTWPPSHWPRLLLGASCLKGRPHWSGFLPNASCRGSADAPHPSFCLMDHGGLDRGPYLRLIIHTSVIFIECLCNSAIWSHDIYSTCPSWRGILLCCSPEGFFPPQVLPFFPLETDFSISWEFFLIRCEVKGQGCCTLSKIHPSILPKAVVSEAIDVM